jgi:D-beta-D-heptose 7-phosphate kinase / D-beta-D-heptose 1-phosphate adenosyltransferase
MLSEVAHAIIGHNRQRRIRIAVVGDVMIDEYLPGSLARVSQEDAAPVFVSNHESGCILPGGAGNAARTLKHWNADVFLVGIIDERTQSVLNQERLSTDRCVCLDDGRNPVKQRLVDGDRLVLRRDVEKPNYGLSSGRLDELRMGLRESFVSLLENGLDVVLISDYAKGLFSNEFIEFLLQRCAMSDTPVVVDPHIDRMPTVYSGAAILKPNDAYLKAYPMSRNEWQVFRGDVVSTHSANVPDGRTDTGTFACCARRPVAARSRVGAGDCFAAHLALALAHGMSTQLAAELAHSSSRVFVQRPFNEPPHPLAVVKDLDPIFGKIVTRDDLSHYLRTENSQVVLTNGCWDLLHAGHLATLSWAKTQGDTLVVAVNDDQSVRRVKGPGRPIVDQDKRTRILAGLACVDWVVLFPEETPEPLLHSLQPHVCVLVKGPEYSGQEVPGCDLVPEVRFAPSGPGIHATDVINRVLHLNGSKEILERRR